MQQHNLQIKAKRERKSTISIGIDGKLQRRLMVVLALLQRYLLGNARKNNHFTIQVINFNLRVRSNM